MQLSGRGGVESVRVPSKLFGELTYAPILAFANPQEEEGRLRGVVCASGGLSKSEKNRPALSWNSGL